MMGSTGLATTEPSIRDLATAESMPICAVAADGPFCELAQFGRRLLVSGQGVLIEARSPGIHIVLPLVEGEVPAYGQVEPFIKLPSGPLPSAMWDRFIASAVAAHPKEMAALIVAGPEGYEYREPDSSARTGSVTYDDTGYTDGTLVLDVHSHGPFHARFSSTDDASDRSRGGPHISIVFGECGRAKEMTFAARACIGNCLIPLSAEAVRGLFQ